MGQMFKVALVGCGCISANHVSAIISSGHKVVALCDCEKEKAKRLAGQFDLYDVKIYTDYSSMLENEKLDAVHICTPHYLHAPMTIEALRKDICVLCEKPLCISKEQLQDLKKAVSESHAQLGVCHQNRYEPNMIRLREMVKGDVSCAFASVNWHRDASYYNTAYWRGTKEQEGGGVMINQALHTLDLMQWICGFPKSVIAHVSNDTLKGVIEVEDTAIACFILENGKRFTFYATNTSSDDLPVHIQLKSTCGDIFNVENDQLCVNNVITLNREESSQIGKQVWGSGHKTLIKEFYDCIEKGNKFPIGFDEGEKVIRLILSMYESDGELTDIFEI